MGREGMAGRGCRMQHECNASLHSRALWWVKYFIIHRYKADYLNLEEGAGCSVSALHHSIREPCSESILLYVNTNLIAWTSMMGPISARMLKDWMQPPCKGFVVVPHWLARYNMHGTHFLNVLCPCWCYFRRHRRPILFLCPNQCIPSPEKLPTIFV